MDIRTSVMTALTSITVPKYWIKWKGDTNPPPQYIVFQSVNRPDLSADDELHERVHYVYLDIYSETDPYPTALLVRSAMETAGFGEIEMRDVGQANVQVTEKQDYHIAFTFEYMEAV